METFLEISAALGDPAGVVATCADGSCTLEATSAIQTVYPALYTDMTLDLTEWLHGKRETQLPFETLIGLDTFLGGALGVLDSHNPMQPLGAQTPAQQQALGLNLQQSSPMMAQMQQKMNSTPVSRVAGL